MQSNNNRVFCRKFFQEYLISQGTKSRLTVKHTLQQNGIAEQTHKTIFKQICALITLQNILLCLWAEAAMLQAYIYNRTPWKVIEYITSYYKQYRHNVSIDNIHKFGQYIVIQNKNLSKVTDRGYYRQWLGFNNSSKGHIT